MLAPRIGNEISYATRINQEIQFVFFKQNRFQDWTSKVSEAAGAR